MSDGDARGQSPQPARHSCCTPCSPLLVSVGSCVVSWMVIVPQLARHEVRIRALESQLAEMQEAGRKWPPPRQRQRRPRRLRRFHPRRNSQRVRNLRFCFWPRLACAIGAGLACAGDGGAELRRTAGAEVRAMLASRDAAARTRAALAAGASADAQLAGAAPEPALLEPLLDDPVAGDTAAWALGRIPGGAKALAACLARSCAAAPAAARALAGPASAKDPMIDALAAALKGPAAAEAASRSACSPATRMRRSPVRETRSRRPLQRPDARLGAVYALLPHAQGDPVPLESSAARRRSLDPISRRARLGQAGSPRRRAGPPRSTMRTGAWRVEAARGLRHRLRRRARAPLPPFRSAPRSDDRRALRARRGGDLRIRGGSSAAGAAAIPEPASLSAATRGRDRGRALRGCRRARSHPKNSSATHRPCAASLEPEWRSRMRTGALAAELAQERPELLPKAREALHDADARVRGAAAARRFPRWRRTCARCSMITIPTLVQEAAASLAKENAAASLDAALVAVHRLAVAHNRPTGARSLTLSPRCRADRGGAAARRVAASTAANAALT